MFLLCSYCVTFLKRHTIKRWGNNHSLNHIQLNKCCISNNKKTYNITIINSTNSDSNNNSSSNITINSSSSSSSKQRERLCMCPP